jgi:hypothetical protein
MAEDRQLLDHTKHLRPPLLLLLLLLPWLLPQHLLQLLRLLPQQQLVPRHERIPQFHVLLHLDVANVLHLAQRPQH